MKLSRRQLKRIIAKEISHINEVGQGIGMAPSLFPGDIKRADPEAYLAVMSIIDPTMASDLASAGYLSMKGDYEDAAKVLALAGGGVGAGAAAYKIGKMIKGLKKYGISTKKLDKIAVNMKKAVEDADTTKNIVGAADTIGTATQS